jgi:hypothetical protein
MAITYPLDILTDAWPGWVTNFELRWRQEVSRTQAGVTRVRAELDYWRARLDALEGGLKTFKGTPLSRYYPVAYPRGSWPTGVSFDGVSAQVHTVSSTNSLRLKLLPAAYVVSVGDMISIAHSSTKQCLVRAMETVTADGSGITAAFEVRPHLAVGVAANDVVSVKRPWCPMTLVPGSLATSSEDNGRGKISFDAVEYR